MQQRPAPISSAPAASPAASLGKHIRWQVILALVGMLLLVTLLGYSTYSVATTMIPANGGVFREGVAGNPRYLNPLRCLANDVDQDLCALLFRGLTRIDKNGRVVPDLAETWTITDGIVYTFRLKPDQYWHDGHRVTVDDVLFTLDIVQDPEVHSLPNLASIWRTIVIEKVNDLTVRFTLSEPFTPFLDYTTLGLLPKHVWGDLPNTVLAAGALDGTPVSNNFVYITEMSADHIRLEPNPFYSGNKPFISALELRFYPDHPSLFAAYTAGEIDGISLILPPDLPVAVARSDLQLFSTIQPGYLHIVFNLDNPDLPFFRDKRVRQALYYAINRELLIEEIAAGQGLLAHSPLLPENWAYNPDVRKYFYSLEQANQLLDEAGWIDTNGDGVRDKEGRPLQFLLSTNDDPTRLALIQRISLDWEEIGVRAVATRVTFQGLVADLLGPRRFDAALIGWEATGDPDPYPLWHSTQKEGGGQNYSGWHHEEADEIMQQARAIINPDKRKELYARFQAIFTEEVPALLLYHPVYTYGVSDRVQNVQIGSLNHPSERFNTFADWYIVTRRVPANQVPTSAPPTPPSASSKK